MRAEDGPHFIFGTYTVADLAVEPGATVCGLPGSVISVRSHSAGDSSVSAFVHGRGTAEHPVRFTATDTVQGWLGIDGSQGISMTLTHALIEHTTREYAGWGGHMTIHDSHLRRLPFAHCGNISSVDIRRTLFEGSGVCISDGIFEDNTIRGGGLQIVRDRPTPGVARVLRCTITDSPYYGIRVLDGAPAEIHECNLERNAGLGVDNFGTATVDARRNWWGDPAGPHGPAGDGVSGNVDASEHLTVRRTQ